MCTEIAIRRRGMRYDIYVSSVRELARYFPVIVTHPVYRSERPLRRMATHCCCPVDIHESAKRSGYEVIDEPMQIHPDIVVRKRAR